MLFNVETDEGTRISGWLMPDNPAEPPSVILVMPDGKEVEVIATVARPEVVNILREAFGFSHNTGVIGFVIDEHTFPKLSELQDVEILSKDGRVPIYKRYQISRHLEKRLCYFDLSVMPQRRIQRGLSDHFTLSYPQVHRYPMETFRAVVGNASARSILVSGRPAWSRNGGILRDLNYIITALLRDPYEELAERLVFINALIKSKAAHLLPLFVADVPDLIEFARDLPFADDKALAAKFRTASQKHREALMSPMTRVFACGVDELPQHRHVSVALENLATLDLVGVRTRFSDFRAIFNDILQREVIAEDSLDVLTGVQELCATLSQIGIVSDLLEHDLNLYAHVSRAVGEGVDGI